MSEQTLANNNGKALANYGDRDTIRELADRLQNFIAGANKLTQQEALTLAQIAIAHGLDPFNGEVWILKSEKDGVTKYAGTMIGIKGLRKMARRQLPKGETFWINLAIDAPDKVIASNSEKVSKAVVWRCELRDSLTIREWTERMKEIQSGLNVDYTVAREIVGPAPVFVGYGIAYTDEFSKMNLHDRARKRAEAQAMRLRFEVSFAVGEQDDAESIEAEYLEIEAEQESEQLPQPEKRTEAQTLFELGY